ncbi:hypothetical protein WT56_29670 [Burkholderia pseudomultivorans]|uniref:Cyclic nucleotide-binding domain-containing protein n=1 Tax=Burkholderia pseudomultivorans TaxID=1207504 RepID=A0A132E8Z1_9BURK|nr:hypothetical protein WT56_29670 [Burkholderia pseudomultivorans]
MMICTIHQVRGGEALYRLSALFNSIYAMRTGSFKTVVMHLNGDEQVTGFQIVGQFLGFDGIHMGHHNRGAIALEDSTECIIPLGQLKHMCREVASMQHHVYKMMGSEIVRESFHMLLLGTLAFP